MALVRRIRPAKAPEASQGPQEAPAEVEAAAPSPAPIARRRGPPKPRTAEQVAVDTARAETKSYIPALDQDEKYAAEDRAARSEAARLDGVVARYMARVKNPLTAIRARCIQCTNGQPKEVLLCPCTTCALHPFRQGVNPYNKKTARRLAAEGGVEDDGRDDGDDDE